MAYVGKNLRGLFGLFLSRRKHYSYSSTRIGLSDPAWLDYLQYCNGIAAYVNHNFWLQLRQELVLTGLSLPYIIVNSFFGWRVTWLANQRWGVHGLLVIAQTRWFVDTSKQYLRDRYPAHWEVLA